MKEKFRLRNMVLIMSVVLALVIGGGSYMLYYYHIRENIMIPYFSLWIIIPSVFYMVVFGLIYMRSILHLSDEIIHMPYPLNKQRPSKLSYSEIKEVIIKGHNGVEYLYGFRDDKNNDYLISNLTGKETANEILNVLKEKLEEKGVEIKTIRS